MFHLVSQLYTIVPPIFPVACKIGGTMVYNCDTRWNILSLGKCLRANSLWHVYLGSVFRRTAWPYPGTTCPDFNKFSQNVFTCSSDASIPISLTTFDKNTNTS